MQEPCPCRAVRPWEPWARRSTHVELQVLCPLAHEAIAGRAGVAAVELEDVVAPRGVPVLVEHHWGASTAWGKQTGQNPTSQHHICDGVTGGTLTGPGHAAMQRGHWGHCHPQPSPTDPSSLPSPAAWEQTQQGQVSLPSSPPNARNVTRLFLLPSLPSPCPQGALHENHCWERSLSVLSPLQKMFHLLLRHCCQKPARSGES